jgi:hypothetical protein
VAVNPGPCFFLRYTCCVFLDLVSSWLLERCWQLYFPVYYLYVAAHRTETLSTAAAETAEAGTAAATEETVDAGVETEPSDRAERKEQAADRTEAPSAAAAETTETRTAAATARGEAPSGLWGSDDTEGRAMMNAQWGPTAFHNTEPIVANRSLFFGIHANSVLHS